MNKIKDFWLYRRRIFNAISPINEEKKRKIKPFKGSLIDSQNARPFASSEIKVEEPKFSRFFSNCCHLRQNKPVIINLKYLDQESGKRLVDFICGTAYAINGHMMKIGENIFLFTPANVLIANSEEKTTFEQGIEEEEKQVFFNKAAAGIQ